MFLKKTFLVALTLVSSITAFSQLSISAKAGANLSNINLDFSDSEIDSDWKPSFHAGLSFSLGSDNKFSFESDLLYSRKGFVFNASETDEIIRGQFNYINLSPSAVLAISNGVSVHFGVQFGYMIDVYYKYTNGEFDGDKVNAEGIFDERFDFALTGGVNYRVSNIMDDKLSFALRYEYGVSPLAKMVFQDGSRENVGFHRNLQLSLKYDIFKR